MKASYVNLPIQPTHGQTTDAVAKRHQLVAGMLATQLDKMFRAGRTHDGKELTDGEVQSALGVLIAGHVGAADKVAVWVHAIELSATLAFTEKQRQAEK
jgi:hypothetical protein